MKFRFSKNFVIDTSKEPFNREGLRITMLGGPGSGKSYNNCLIAEQFLTQSGTIVVFQPRDEYYTLKEKFDVVCVGGVHAVDVPFVLMKPKMYARAVVEDGISMIFYTAGKDEEKLVQWTSRFIEHVLTLQETHHRPLLIILEEAQEYVPKSAAGHSAPPWVFNRMIRTFKKCFTEGRKLNVIAIGSSQRPQLLDFTIRQLANVKFFGKFSSQDIKYVDKECLKIIREEGIDVKASRLLHLKKGEWLVNCELMTEYIMVTHPRLTKHGAETPKLEYIAPRTNETKRTVSDLAAAIKEALEKEAAEQSELEKLKRKNRDLEKKLEAAEEKARIKLSVKDMLEAGSEPAELAEKLAEAETEIKDLRKKLAQQRPPEEAEKLQKRIQFLETKTTQLEKQVQKDKDDLRLYDDFRSVLRRMFPQPAGPPGFEPGKVVPSVTIAEIDERINQRLAGSEPARVVTVNVNQRIKELVKNDYVNRLVAKIQSLPEPAKKAALWLHEKKSAKIGDLYYYMYEKTGRIPGNFYANVVKPLENAWLIINEAGNVRWILQEKLSSELKDVLRDGDVQEIAKYLTSLLL